MHEERDDVLFVCVNIGDSKEVITDYWKEGGFTMPVAVQEEDEVSKAFGVKAYPTNVLVGPDGKVLWQSVGWDESGLEHALERTRAED